MTIPIHAPVTAHRMPDITIPLFTPPYTVPTASTPVGPMQVSLFPCFFTLWNSIQSSNPFAEFLTNTDAFTVTSEGYGRSIGNAGVPLGNHTTTFTGPVAVYGTLLAGSERLASINGRPLFVAEFPIVSAIGGKTLSKGISNKTIFNNFIIGNNAHSASFHMAAIRHQGQLEVAFTLGYSNGVAQAYAMFPVVGGGPIDYGQQFSDGNVRSNFVAAIPDLDLLAAQAKGFTGPVTWVISGGNDGLGNSGYLVGPWSFEDKAGWLSVVIFDDPMIQTLFAGNSVNQVQASEFGFLIKNNGTALFGNQCNYMLLAKDGSRFAMIRLQGQDKLSAGDINISTSRNNGYSVMLDPMGVFYMVSEESRGTASLTVLNSFSETIPWAPVTVPALAFPPFSIPNLCGCPPPNYGIAPP